MLTLNLLKEGKGGRNVIFIKTTSLPCFLLNLEAEKWWVIGKNKSPTIFLQNHSNQTAFLPKIFHIFSHSFFILSIFTPIKHSLGEGEREIRTRM